MMNLFRTYLQPYVEYVDVAAAGNAGPTQVGVFLAKEKR